ncbi:MAG: hypothetical protein ACK55Z_03290 [bacterium]
MRQLHNFMEAEGFLDFIKGNADPDSVSVSQFSKGQAFHCFLHKARYVQQVPCFLR